MAPTTVPDSVPSIAPWPLSDFPSSPPTSSFHPSNVLSMAPTTYEQRLKAPPTLNALGVTLGIGLLVFSIVLLGFAVAMRCRSTHIAPRCEARPRNVIYNPDPACHPSQKKGNPFLLGWVFWVLSVPYRDMLHGIPGTGTRDGGMKGRMLSVNLDHIILLRFNYLGLKLATCAMVVYCATCLPIYFYARCSWVEMGDDAMQTEDVAQNCTEQNYTFSSYSRFTLANVPDLTTRSYLDADYHLASFQLYMVSIASWIVMWYAFFELFHEWVDEVAIRRVYYLEYNHWQGAKDELKATMLRASGNEVTGNEKPPEKHIVDRKIWIPHPEQRDTPSNIELYSVLVGGIPSRPSEAMNQEDLEAALANNNSPVDWQMCLVSAFFDACIPNQPGFSSSIAAVTILPSSIELAIAWRHWYKATAAVSRLRFIRRRIIELGGIPVGQRLVVDRTATQVATNGRAIRGVNPDEAIRRQNYIVEVLGAGFDDNTDDEFLRSLDLGPEQLAVYSLEFANGLSGCCPHGFCEERISYCKDLDFLLELEAEAADAAADAYAALKAAVDVAMSHEKPKDMVTLPDLTTAFVQPKVDVSQLRKSTTETKLIRKHLSDVGRSQFNGANGMENDGVNSDGSFNGLPKADSKKDVHTPTSPSIQRPGFDSGLMHRASVARLNASSGSESKKPDLWEVAETIASESKNYKNRVALPYQVENGKWSWPSVRRACVGLRRKVATLLLWTCDNSNEAADLLARDSTFAVVTFTSRQAAVAARQCLADGRGAEAFTTAKSLPVPPLADSAAFNICDCRGFCRPVTIGLNESQKQWRFTVMSIAVALLYVFYTIPIGYVSEVATKAIIFFFPDIQGETSYFQGASLAGWVEGQVLALFLSFLPDLFLFLANFGSNATSLVESENTALRFYWFFMVCFAMIGASIVQMGREIYNSGSVDVREILQTIARTIPVDVSSTWTNWIISKTLTFTPAFYLLQLNTFLSACFGASCCVRLFRGGGDGTRLPYRIYVENGTVLLLTLALAPAAPILSPFAVLYFLVCTPLLKFVLIFTYKPPFDSGGSRWPRLFEMIITSMVVAQIILATCLLLKQALGPAIIAALAMAPIFSFRHRMVTRFLKAYNDAGLLQTSMLDGWDVGVDSEALSWRDREEFRRFLVDGHKASYVPVCVSATQGGARNRMTAEPAVVVGMTEQERREMDEDLENDRDRRARFKWSGLDKTQQFGALNRRHVTAGLFLSLRSQDHESVKERSIEQAETSTATPLALVKKPSTANLSESEPDPQQAGVYAQPSFASSRDEIDPPQSTNFEGYPPMVEPENPDSEGGRDRYQAEVHCVAKVTRLGSMFTLESGEIEFDFANVTEKQKDA